MPIDWTQPEFTFLANKLKLGQVCLFAGAGFSSGARNKFGQALPLGGKLAELLAERAGEMYRGESLPTVFEAVETTIGTNDLWSYLRDLYSVCDADEWYRLMGHVTWHRIYSTNIDDLFQYLLPYPSKQKLDMLVRGDSTQERDPHFEHLQCIHLHGHVKYRQNGLTFTLPAFATHTARPDPWYQTLANDINTRPVVFVGTQLEEPILSHYLELREPKPRDADREYRPKSFLVSPSIGGIKTKAMLTRNIIAVEATAQEFFESLQSQVGLAELSLSAVRATVWPHLFATDRTLASDVIRDFDPIVPDSLPIGRPDPTSRFFLGAEPTWDDIGKRRDGEREVNKELLQTVSEPTDSFRLIVLHGPAGSGKTTTFMRVANDLAESGHLVFYARGTQRLDFDGLLRLSKEQELTGKQVFVFVDIASRHIGAIVAKEDDFRQAKGFTLLVADRTNRYASKCQRLGRLDPIEVKMPDLSEPDVHSLLNRLTSFGFLGVLKNRPYDEQVQEFMVRAKRQLLVAMREATSGKDFDLILKDEYHELVREAQIAYTVCCIAVAQGAPGVYMKHLTPCVPRSGFTKGVVIDDLLRGVLIPANETGHLLKPRHGLIAYWVATEIAPDDIKYQALSAFLKTVSSSIVPNEIRRRSPAYLAYRGMVNSDGLFKIFGGNSKPVLELYEDVRSFYDNDFLFWLQYGMAHIRAGNLDIAENYLNQSLNINPYSHQTLHHLGILYLVQASTSDNAGAMQTRAEQGMDVLMDQIKTRGDYDSYPYHAYLTHVARWYSHAGKLISLKEWEDLRAFGRQARDKYRLDDTIRGAADEVERLYLRRAIAKEDNRNAGESK